MPDQFHARFFRISASFFVVAFKAAADDVIPGFSASLHDRNDMVKREVFGRTLLAAILTGIVIASVNIRSAKLDVLKMFPDLYVLQQAKNAGHLDGETDAANLSIVFGQNLNLALTQQIERTPPGHNVDRFISRV
jgi:hypothetical protein